VWLCRKPRLTRLRQSARIAYVGDRLKTDVRMLPQSGPLEGRVADTVCGHHETDSPATPVANIVEGSELGGAVAAVPDGIRQA